MSWLLWIMVTSIFIEWMEVEVEPIGNGHFVYVGKLEV